jgi:hypothetical protein
LFSKGTIPNSRKGWWQHHPFFFCKSIFALFSIFLILLFISNTLQANEIKVAGVILDSQNNKPISGVNILEEQSGLATVSDNSGEYRLKISLTDSLPRLEFSHISYEKLSLSLPAKDTILILRLTKRILPWQPVTIYEKGSAFRYNQELSNSVLTLSIDETAAKGARDISDLLISDQRLSIVESQNGKKEVFVRGMGEDEMVVLLNGVQINSNYEQRYDFSLIDLSNFSQVDLIVGNNLAVPSAIGTAAALNLIPKFSDKNSLELAGSIGTHQTESWRIGSALALRDLSSYFSINQRHSSQRYLGESPDSASIQRETKGAAANVRYEFPDAGNWPMPDYGEYNFLYADRNYQNRTYFETLNLQSAIHNGIVSLPLNNQGAIKMVYSRQNLREISEWDIRGSRQEKSQLGESNLFSSDLTYAQDGTELFLNYQWSEDAIQLTAPTDSGDYGRNRTFFSGGMAFSGSHLQEQLFSVLQFNMAWDHIKDTGGQLGDKEALFSYFANGSIKYRSDKIHYTVYVNTGNSVRLPTLSQQVLRISAPLPADIQQNIQSEQKQMSEIGFSANGTDKAAPFLLFKNLSLSLFSYRYQNKIRLIPYAGGIYHLYDNHQNASNRGYEASVGIGILREALTVSLSSARYYYSDPLAFPLKPTAKETAALRYHWGILKGEMVWFQESEKQGLIAFPDTGFSKISFAEVKIDPYWNLNVSAGIYLKLWEKELNLILNGFNLVEQALVFDGIMLNERKLALTMEIKL